MHKQVSSLSPRVEYSLGKGNTDETRILDYSNGDNQSDILSLDDFRRLKQIHDLIGWENDELDSALTEREDMRVESLVEFERIFKDIENRIKDCRYSELFFAVAGLDRVFADLKSQLAAEDIADIEVRIQKMVSPELERLLSDAIESGKGCATIGKKQQMKQFLDRINGILKIARKLNLELDFAKYKKSKQEIVSSYREAKLKKQLEESLESFFEGAFVLATAGNKAEMEKLLESIASILKKAKDSKFNWNFAEHENRIQEIRAICEKKAKESPEVKA
jgi:hypothetical protein